MFILKAVFWTGETHRTINITKRDIHFAVILLAALINDNNWELVSLEKQ